MTFYEKYLKLCASVGKSPSAVGLDVGVSKATVSRWKNGGGATDSTLQKIADYFNVDLEYLADDEPEEKPQYYLNDDAMEYAQFLFENPEYKVLFDASRKVKKEDIEFVKEMIDRVRGNADE